MAGTAPGGLDRARVAGFASLGYRLSIYPGFAQDAATTPAAQMRLARHPDHIRDVWAALGVLAGDGDGDGSAADFVSHNRFVVYGHSCGAFLAFQLWMGAQATEDASRPPPPARVPACVVGLEGLYDLRGLVDRGGSPAHGGGPGTGFAAVLLEIAEGAFGRDRAAWDRASPGRFDWSTFGGAKSAATALAVLAYSPEDELVDVGEVDTMDAALQRGGALKIGDEAGGENADGLVQYLVLRDLHGRHDEVHEDGREVARVLAATVQQLDRLGRA